ncbi:DUF4150 domain-containing protein [Mesorhizobium escarrei]|uniref:DUF4150 domain-containing protein n=1 Tax=Mesorhizobium escarrei TaxID=666018 RepID=A0ABN8JFM8_9HYPH|nr:DUF4150 domain-containing protein [Mesorhizobium escarrei]CAH2396626.1 conserved hypothetical protein [Mesorhizobium escarrei]
MTSHVSVNNLGLTYKGTIGISMATIPDVCKTPSPGGPIPIPYPNIAQQSSLSDGTTTVFAKGKMIANKGSHYSRSNGDEAGTVGGVKSNVNMKATDWITYSFDVKMDGKNACRHTDKKFHNDKNTVDLGGNQDPRSKTEGTELVILCCGAPKGKSRKTKKKRKAYSDCELEEICAKIKQYNDKLTGQPSEFTDIKQVGARREDNDRRRNNECRRIKRRAREGVGPEDGTKPHEMGFHDVSDDCKKKLEAKAKRADPKYSGFSPDHVQEIQHNGHPTRLENLRWMSSKPNKWIGGAMNDLETSGPGKHESISGDCCPPSNCK